MVVELQGNAEGRATTRQITLQAGDTLPALVFLLMDGDGGVYDLASATVTFRMREREADAGTYVVEEECTVLSSGVVIYNLAAADTATPGEYYAELEMDFGGGLVYTSEVFVIRIRVSI